MYYFNNLLTCWALSMLLIAALAWRSWETCCLTWARYWETSALPSANLFWANSVTLPAIMLFLSLKRQSDPPKKQSRETTFWRNPSLELACSVDWDLMASSMVEWIWALISLLEGGDAGVKGSDLSRLGESSLDKSSDLLNMSLSIDLSGFDTSLLLNSIDQSDWHSFLGNAHGSTLLSFHC